MNSNFLEAGFSDSYNIDAEARLTELINDAEISAKSVKADLKEVDAKLVSTARSRVNALLNEDAHAKKSAKASPYVNFTEGILILPYCLICDMNWLTILFMELARSFNLKIFSFEGGNIQINDADEDFLRGINYQIFSTKKINLKYSGRREFEIGRILTFALQIKSEIEDAEMLGPQALRKDNFFFGNYPRSKGSKHNDQSMFEIKRRWGRLFKMDETGLATGLCLSF
jgi:hypothetical protein